MSTFGDNTPDASILAAMDAHQTRLATARPIWDRLCKASLVVGDAHTENRDPSPKAMDELHDAAVAFRDWWRDGDDAVLSTVRDATVFSDILVERFDCEGKGAVSRCRLEVQPWCMACKEPVGSPHLADCDRIVDAGNRELRERGRPKVTP